MSLVGTTIGNYRVTRQLGEGGMGVVYEAEHPVIGRKVAIKVLHAELARDPERRRALLQRGARDPRRSATRTSSRSSTSARPPTAQPYFVMELLDGETLERRASRATARCRSSGRWRSRVQIVAARSAPRTRRASSTATSSRDNIYLVPIDGRRRAASSCSTSASPS